MLYLLLAIAIGVGATVYLIKKGKIKDSDGDLIPDAVEEKVAEVKLHAKRITEEVVDATKKNPRRGRKPASKKPSGSGGRVEKKPRTSGEDSATLKNQQ